MNEQTQLQHAIYDADFEEIIRLLDGGADVNEVNCRGESLLTEAIIYFESHPSLHELVRKLLARGADAQLLSPDGSGPLFSAAIIMDAEVTRMLLAAGADPNKEHDGCQPP